MNNRSDDYHSKEMNKNQLINLQKQIITCLAMALLSTFEYILRILLSVRCERVEALRPNMTFSSGTTDRVCGVWFSPEAVQRRGKKN